MTTGMLQDTVQTAPSGSGPRFRPYASPNHHVTKGRYITSNDVRGYIPVYEYPLNGQWIMMDIDDGYILWTGIWKALGNSKADIVKMIDSQPDLAPLIRRVRGGYLKIQGTWMPYEVALKLSRRVAWTIRDDLIPLFGPTFPSTCLSPDQPGYGQVVPSGQGRRRSRRSNVQTSMMQIPRAPGVGWTVVTPGSGNMPAGHAIMRERGATYSTHGGSVDYPMGSPYPSHAHVRVDDAHPENHHHYHHLQHIQPQHPDARSLSGPTAPHDSTHSHHGYPNSPYTSHHPPTSFRKPTGPTTNTGLSLDTRSLSMRDESSSNQPSPQQEDIRLAPIHSENASGGSSNSPYALPPISAMESLRDCSSSDSAAVLRRLRMDDDDAYPSKTTSKMGDDSQSSWGRRHSLSTSKPSDTSPRFQPYGSPRSQHENPTYRPRSSSASRSHYSHYPHHHHPQPSAAKAHMGWSGASHEADSATSTSNPSPTSPATPNSIPENEDQASQSQSHSQAHYSGNGANAHGSVHNSANMAQGKHFPEIAGRLNQPWPSSPHSHSDGRDGRISEADSYSFRRNSYEVHSDNESTHPHRPW